MYDGAREVNSIHPRAVSCRDSGCKDSGNFLEFFRVAGTHPDDTIGVPQPMPPDVVAASGGPAT